ncbi:universal stress protein A-like protein isoform X1 [Chenopodium quinoa]|uniref:universal stress protein A-like protein isoform X1 n=1 Tax=Chenopodium quinoa TaxID=63459 RepID=UPI000B773522|nr:universal stress protein A-like protein isoform X1 [Chenopodium quinoa]
MGSDDVVVVADGRDGEARKIVVAVDESEESMYALSWCLNNIVQGQPRNCKDALVLLHAKRPTVVYPGLDSSAYLSSHDALSSLDRRDNEMACWILQKADKLCAEHDVKVEKKVEEGDPGDVICEMVNVLKADLLIMGSHGYSQLTRSILRSVSHHCVQNASCPVLVVKMPK